MRCDFFSKTRRTPCYSRIEPTTGRQLRSKLASVEEGNGCDALDDTAAREIQVHVDLFGDTVFSATASSVGMNEKRVLPGIFGIRVPYGCARYLVLRLVP